MVSKTSFKRMLPFAAIALTAALPTVAAASGNNQILETSCTFLEQIRGWIFSVAYVLGAIGLVIIAVSAFLGRFKFSHLIALGGGLFIVATADMLIRFITEGDSEGTDCVV